MSAMADIGMFPKPRKGKITIKPALHIGQGRYKNHIWEPGHDPREQRMNAIGQRTPGKECPDCGCDVQFVNGRWRCPWITPEDWRKALFAGECLAGCNQPFKRSDQPLVLGTRDPT